MKSSDRRLDLNDGRVAHLAAVMTHPVDQTLVGFLAYTGVRFGEGAAARVAAFNTMRRRVESTEAQAEVSGELVLSGTKTHKRRSVPYPSFLSELLAALMVGKDRDDLVFARPGTQLRLANWRPRRIRASSHRMHRRHRGAPGGGAPC